MRLPFPPLLVISDRRQARHPLETVAKAAFEAGCRWFSLREKDLPSDERRALLSTLIVLGRRYGSTVSVHDDLEAALETGAAGLHLPSGGNPSAARALLPDGLIGASAQSAEEASRLRAAGADYVTVSPVFMTASKPGYGPALGLEGLAGVVAQAPGPVIALGGITAQNAGRCLAAGAHGVAIMGEVMRAADPRAAVVA
ncbi:MAG: thiamine phosphate synthase, partial [Stellaceae bacterium]